MILSRHIRIGLVATAVLGAIAAWWPFNLAWPVLRTAEYLALVAEIERAQEVPERPGGSGWELDVPVSRSGVTAKVTGGHAASAVRVRYSDEAGARQLYDHRDYSSPRSIKTAGQTIFVCWTETLFGSETWLVAYDLDARREIRRRRVVPGDVGL